MHGGYVARGRNGEGVHRCKGGQAFLYNLNGTQDKETKSLKGVKKWTGNYFISLFLFVR